MSAPLRHRQTVALLAAFLITVLSGAPAIASQLLVCHPDSLGWPSYISVPNNTTVTKQVTLINLGDETIQWTSVATYTPPYSGWIVAPDSGTVLPGLQDSTIISITLHPTNSAVGVYGKITFSYDGGAESTDLNVRAWTYNATWIDPTWLHTATNKILVDQGSSVGIFRYYSAPDDDYLYTGSLILGNAADNLSWRAYYDDQQPGPNSPFRPDFGTKRHASRFNVAQL